MVSDVKLVIVFCFNDAEGAIMHNDFNPFTAKDAIWRPRGITHLRICLLARYNFYYAFQQPMC